VLDGESKLRFGLIVALALLVTLALGTPNTVSASPTCTSVGTGFTSTEPMMGSGKTPCGSAGFFQDPIWCRVGTMTFTYDCVYENGSYHPVNVMGTPSHCQRSRYTYLVCR